MTSSRNSKIYAQTKVVTSPEGNAYRYTDLAKGKCFLPNQKKKRSVSGSTQRRKHVRNDFVLIAKFEQLTKKRLFPSRKLTLEEESTGG